jgi:nucleoside-triphosphatase THEP1
LPGIGKTSICKRMGLFVSERGIFKDGLIYISMRGKKETSNLIETLFQYFTRVNLELKKEEQALKIDIDKMTEKIFEILSNTDTLIMIDNIEEVLNRDE